MRAGLRQRFCAGAGRADNTGVEVLLGPWIDPSSKGLLKVGISWFNADHLVSGPGSLYAAPSGVAGADSIDLPGEVKTAPSEAALPREELRSGLSIVPGIAGALLPPELRI